MAYYDIKTKDPHNQKPRHRLFPGVAKERFYSEESFWLALEEMLQRGEGEDIINICVDENETPILFWIENNVVQLCVGGSSPKELKSLRYFNTKVRDLFKLYSSEDETNESIVEA